MLKKLLNYLFVIPFIFKKSTNTLNLTLLNNNYNLDEFVENTTQILNKWLKQNENLKEFEEIDKLELHCLMKDQIDLHFPKSCELKLELEFIADPYYNLYTTKIYNALIIKTEFKQTQLDQTSTIYMYWIVSLHRLQVNSYKYCFFK